MWRVRGDARDRMAAAYDPAGADDEDKPEFDDIKLTAAQGETDTKRSNENIGAELSDAIMAVIDEYSVGLSTITVLGVLEVAKATIVASTMAEAAQIERAQNPVTNVEFADRLGIA